jgi:hypothetical protein
MLSARSLLRKPLYFAIGKRWPSGSGSTNVSE